MSVLMKHRFFQTIMLALAIMNLPACSSKKDAADFKHEYEVLNGQTTPDGEHEYKHIDIPDSNPFIYVDGETAKEKLTSGTGVLYMGFPECPWCRTLMPALIEAYGESGYKGKIYYYNGLADRDVLSLSDSGQIVTEEAGAQVYHDLVKILYDYLTPYDGLNDASIRRIYFPTTVFFKDGAIKSVHLDTVDSQKNGYDELTVEQYAQLKNTLLNEINAIK